MSHTHVHPIGIQDLPHGKHACQDCGLPVDGPTSELLVLVRQRADGFGGIMTFNTTGGEEFGLCESCSARRAAARGIVHAIPSLSRYGSPSILADRLAYVLITIDALGRARPDTWTSALVGDALARLELVGSAFCWSRRFAPIWLVDARLDTCASEPWLHASAEVWDDARWQMNEFVIDRLVPHPIPCPTGGCTCCGVATLSARRPTEAWLPTPSGKYSGRHLCVACNKHRDIAMGPTMVNAALLDFLDGDREFRRKHGYRDPRFNLPLWADTGAAPTSRPWAWADLSPAREVLKSGDW